MPELLPHQDPEAVAAIRAHYEVECELANRLRRADPEERRRLYGPVYDEFFRRVKKQPQLAQRVDEGATRELVALQRQLLSPFLTSTSRFLDIGSGDCSLCLDLAPTVASAIAIEASAEISKKALGADVPDNFRLVIDGRLDFSLASGDLSTEDSSRRDSVRDSDTAPTVAFSCHFVEHLHADDLLIHLRAVHRCLAPEGVYVLVTPNRLWGPHDVSRFFEERATGFHLNELTHADLARSLRQAGFRRVRRLAGLGVTPRVKGLGLVAGLERTLDRLPRSVRRTLLALGSKAAQPPFRRLEQVLLVGWK